MKRIPFHAHFGFLIYGCCSEEAAFQTRALRGRGNPGFLLLFYSWPVDWFLNLQSFALCSRCLTVTWIYLQPFQEMGFGAKSELRGTSAMDAACTWHLAPGTWHQSPPEGKSEAPNSAEMHSVEGLG